MKKMTSILSLVFIASTVFAAEPASNVEKVTIEFTKENTSGENILTLEGQQAEALAKLLPTAQGMGGAGELTQTKGELICGGQPVTGKGIQYQCFMLLKK